MCETWRKLFAKSPRVEQTEIEKPEEEIEKPEPDPEPVFDAPSSEAPTTMNTLQLQTALRDAGYDPGPLDGVPGTKTRNAVKAFQMDHGLTADGIAGPKTTTALFGKAVQSVQHLPWYVEAYSHLGLKEDPSKGSNPVIMSMAEELDLDSYTNDDIPWCGLFVGYCVNAHLDEPTPSNPLGARNWAKFGIECEPQMGAILVFWRGSKDGWTGHVGFYSGEDSTAFHVLGGNQSNSVTITRISKDRLLAARWPATALAPEGTKLVASLGGELSTNEA